MESFRGLHLNHTNQIRKEMKARTKFHALERRRPVFFQIGMIIALSLSLLAFEWKTTRNLMTLTAGIPREGLEEIAEVSVHKKIEKPLPKPKPTILFNTITDEIKVDDPDIFNPEDHLGKEIEPWVPPLPEEQPEDGDEPFLIVESMPSFPGGHIAMLRFLKENIRYPRVALESNISGVVHLSFVIGRDGSVYNIKVLRGIGGGCDEEAVRVVEMMPPWIPGKQRGKAVNVAFNLPVSFILR